MLHTIMVCTRPYLTEMNTYSSQFKAFWAAENIVNTIHNIYTLRGSMVIELMRTRFCGEKDRETLVVCQALMSA